MRIVIAGATGFIGKRLCSKLNCEYEVSALTRDVNRVVKSLGREIEAVKWDAKTSGGWEEVIEGSLAVVNLAGESIEGRWTEEKRTRILRSRVDSCRAIIEAIRKANNKPKVFIQASAIGYYGLRVEEGLDEESKRGEGFLAEVCDKVEGIAKEIGSCGVKSVIIRTGVVLGAGGGALARFITPFKFFLGGWPGDGQRWFSWISIEDEIEAIKFLIEGKNLEGVFNLTAPQSVRMKEFCKILAKLMNRPCVMPIPAFILRFFFGQIADEVILSGQNVTPKRLLQSGFEFRYRDAEGALKDILKEGR